MKLFTCLLPALLFAGSGARAADQKVAVRFQAMVGSEKFACGRSYPGIGTTASTLTPRDFRFYVHNFALIDDAGRSGCVNGTPDTNDRVTGTVPEGHYTGVRFTLGVPFNKNHTNLTTQPSPLNLTALAWVWNRGRKFARMDFSSTGMPRGYAVHLGSTGCTPNHTKTAPPAQCSEPNRVDVELAGFDAQADFVVADLAALLKDSNIDANQEKTAEGCMSSPNDSDCAPLFANLGLPFAGKPAGKQSFFRKSAAPDAKPSSGVGN